MAADSPTPLATVAQMQEGPFGDLVRDYSAQALSDLMVQATRAVEDATGRRLAPFTLTESQRMTALDVEDGLTEGMPLPNAAQISAEYGQARGVGNLVRHFWVRHYPPHYPDLWSPAAQISALNVAWSFGGTTAVAPTSLQYEPDTGHVRFLIGTFVPPGSTATYTYTGGYSTTPAGLLRATLMQAAVLALEDLNPEGGEAHETLAGRLELAIEPWMDR